MTFRDKNIKNRKVTLNKLNFRLKELDSWAQSEVLTFLLRYKPRSEEELFDILSLLDGLLHSSHAHVMAATLRLFLRLAAAHPAVQADALEQARGPLLATCGSQSRELRFAGLCHIQQVLVWQANEVYGYIVNGQHIKPKNKFNHFLLKVSYTNTKLMQ